MNTTKHDGLSLISSEYSQYRILNGSIYMLVEGYNGLFRASTEDGRVELIKKFIYRRNYESYPFHLMKKNHRLIFIPARADEIAIYDEVTDELYEIPLGWGTNREWLMRDYIFADGRLWIFPVEEKKALEVDCENGKVIADIDFGEIYRSKMGKDYRFFSASGCYYWKEKVFLAYYEVPYFAVLELKTKKISSIYVPEAEKGFTALQGKGGRLYSLNADGRLIIWNIDGHQVETFINIGESVPDFDAVYYTNMHIVGQELFICGSDVAQMVNVSLSENYKISRCLSNLISETDETALYGKLQFRYYEENFLYGCDEFDHCFCIDLLSKALVDIWKITFDSDEIKRAIRDESMLLNKIQKVIPENAVAFEDMICGKMRGRRVEKADSQVGQLIYQNVIKDL